MAWSSSGLMGRLSFLSVAWKWSYIPLKDGWKVSSVVLGHNERYIRRNVQSGDRNKGWMSYQEKATSASTCRSF